MKNNGRFKINILMALFVIFTLLTSPVLACVVMTYTITPYAEGGGTINPCLPQHVPAGASVTFNFFPDSGYHIADVKVGEVSVNWDPISKSYTFDDVDSDYEITVFFELNIFLPEGIVPDIIGVLPGEPECIPPLPFGDGVSPYYVVVISEAFEADVEVAILYDDSMFGSEAEEENLRLYIGDCVDFNGDGTVSGIDMNLLKKEMKKENPDLEKFDVNNDGELTDADLAIVKDYANNGIIVNWGNNKHDPQLRLPWIDITDRVDTAENMIYGFTSHFSLFRCR